jgi:8-oxo-dGTP diphosphatase
MTNSRDSLAQALTYIVNVEAVVCRDSQYLLVRRSPTEEVAPGLLSFPGGKVDETAPRADVLEDTVRRELLEETGVQVSSITYAGSKTFVTDGGIMVLNLISLPVSTQGGREL